MEGSLLLLGFLTILVHLGCSGAMLKTIDFAAVIPVRLFLTGEQQYSKFNMKAKQDQRNEIRFCQHAGMSMGETIVQLHHVHGNQVLSDSSIRHWFNFFGAGNNQVSDAPCPRQPKKGLHRGFNSSAMPCRETELR